MLVDVTLMGEVVNRPGVQENREIPLDWRECRGGLSYIQGSLA
jgi:hypothetical protein